MRLALRIMSLLTIGGMAVGTFLLELPDVLRGGGFARLSLLVPGWMLWMGDGTLGLVASAINRQVGWLIAIICPLAMFVLAPIVLIPLSIALALQAPFSCDPSGTCSLGPAYDVVSNIGPFLTVVLPILTGVLTLIYSFTVWDRNAIARPTASGRARWRARP